MSARFLNRLRGRVAVAARRRRRPNIVWICADDFACYVSGAYGDSKVRTPNIDRLAAEGIRFDRAYCSCPLSTPSRQAFLTGRYPRSIGVTLSPTPLPEDEVTIASMLRRVGYEAVALGKTHYYAPLVGEFPTHIDLPEHRQWLDAKGPEPLPPGIEVLGRWRPFRDPAAVWLNAAGRPYGAVDGDMSGTFFAEHARRYLEQKHKRPFFLTVNFYETHSPFRFPVEYAGRYAPASFDVPEPSPEDLDRIPGVFYELSPAEKQGILAACYTAVEFMDKNVGIVLEAVDRSPHRDETLVIFCSDHGYLLGQHGLFEKHCCFEPAIRAALIVRLPGLVRPGRTTDALVELIDLVPTILDLCAVPVPADLHGRSLLPLLGESASAAAHRDRIFVEYADNAEGAVRTDRYKLIYCAGNRKRQDGYASDDSRRCRTVRLYDLDRDPGETTDLAQRPEHAALVEELVAALVDHIRRTDRYPELLPDSGDVHEVLAQGLLPREIIAPWAS
jgi:choline-sulfatase